MPYGYNGKILHIDLSNEIIEIEQPDERFYRTYMGGGAMGAYYLLKGVKPGIDPLGPDNLLIFAASIVTGAPVSGFSRHAVITKSPLSGMFLDSQAGGFWGPELKFSGYDAIIISGKAKRPSYIWIKDGKVEIKDAEKHWGMTTGDAQKSIRNELNEQRARMVVIGPAGENLVKYACIMNENKDANGRGGSGAVMGSKNLKAVVCRGTKKIEIKDRDTILKYAKWFAKNPGNEWIKANGTAGIISIHMQAEELPTRNFSQGYIENGEQLSGATMRNTILKRTESCYACAKNCKRVVKTGPPYNVNPEYGGPEYESIAALGSSCGIIDLEAVSKANEMCNRYSLDTISTGSSIAFAMECYENGLLTKEDTEGLEINFGNVEVMLKLVDMIAFKKGKLGKLLAEGTKKASEIIGKGSEKFAMHTKGVEIAMHDGRAKGSVAMGYADGPIGGDHVVNEHDTAFDEFAPAVCMEQASLLGINKRLNAKDIGSEKVRNHMYLQHQFSLMDTLCLCVAAFAPGGTFPFKMLIEMIEAVLGFETSLWELMKVGERRTTLAKVFNYREGLRRKDDILPDRMYEWLKKENGDDIKIDKTQFTQSINLFYEMMNWDTEGKPRKGKLHELDIAWTIDEIY